MRVVHNCCLHAYWLCKPVLHGVYPLLQRNVHSIASAAAGATALAPLTLCVGMPHCCQLCW